MTQREPKVYRLETGVAKGNRLGSPASEGVIVSRAEKDAQIRAYFEAEQVVMARFIKFLRVIPWE